MYCTKIYKGCYFKKSMADKNKLIIRILLLVIVLLSLVVIYAFVVRPAVSGFAINNYAQGYNQGQIDLLNNIVVQLQQAGNAQIPVGESQVLVLQGQIYQTQ